MSRTGTPASPPRFLARENELERIRRRLAATADGSGGLVVVSGQPGTGATRLAAEAAARARQQGFAVLYGRSLAGTLGRPYAALADALETHALALPPAAVQSDLADDAGPILRLCPGLRTVIPRFTPAVPLDAPDERLRLDHAVVAWLGRITARQPVIVVIDDVQHADGDLVRLLEHVGRRSRSMPVLVLAVESLALPASSGRRRRPAGSRLARRARIDTIELEGLDEGATAAILTAVGARPVRPAMIALVQQLAGGAPLHSLQLYEHLVEEGYLAGPGAPPLPAAAELPQTLADVVAWRLSRFGADARAALNSLAAFHDGASPHMLGAVSGLPRGRIAVALEETVANGLAVAVEGGRHFRVAHEPIRVALLDLLPAEQRARLHRRVAEAIEADAGEHLRELAGIVAHHLLRSDARPRALRFCLLAAEQARAAYAYRRATACLQDAISVIPEREFAQRAELLARLAVTQAEAGLRREAERTAAALLDAHAAGGARMTGALGGLIDALRALRGEGVGENDWPAIEELRLAGEARAARADALTRARLGLLAEHWEPYSSGPIDVLHWVESAPEVARMLLDAGDDADRSELMLAQRPRREAQTAKTAEFAGTWRRPPAALRALRCTVVDLVTRRGMFREGGGWAAQYQATAESYGALRDRAAALLLTARCRAALGDLDLAAELSDEAARALADLGATDSDMADEAFLTRAAIAYARDAEWPVLLANLTRAGSRGPRPAGLALAAQRVIGHVRTGGAAEGHELLPPVLEAAAILPPLTFLRDAALVAALAAAWEMGAAEHAAAGRSLIELTADGGAGGQVEGSLGLTLARMHALAGDLEAARAGFAAERPLLDAAGQRPLRAICDHDEGIAIAAAGRDTHGEAARLLESAVAQFEGLGMIGWAARTRALLDTGLERAGGPGGRLHFTYPRGLSRREADLVRLLAAGATLEQAAAELVIEAAAARRLLDSALDKLGGTQADELPRLARRHGLGGV